MSEKASQRESEKADQRISESASQRASGSADQRINEKANQRLTLSPRHRVSPSPPLPLSLSPLLFLAAATLLFFWPVWVMNYRFPIGGGDLWGQLHPVWSYVGEWLRRGVFPLWHTRLTIGDPIVAEGQYGLFNPLNWPLFLFSPVPAWAVTLRGMATLWLAGAGMYLYLHRSPVWRLQRVAALVGALAYMFADPFIAHLGHPQFNDALAWLPWTLWGVDCAARRARAIPWAGAALSLLLLAGHGQASLYGALTVGGYALWQTLAGGRRAPRRLGRLALVGLLAACLAAPGILPGFERLPLSERALVPFELRRGYEFHLEMLIDLLTPRYHGRGALGFWPKWDRVESPYVGAVALYLAALGLATGWRRRRTWALIGLGSVACVFALGYQAPLYPALARLPLFAESWKTGRAIFLLCFALSIGAGLGVDFLLNFHRKDTKGAKVSKGWRRVIAGIWLGALFLGGFWLWRAAPTLATPVPRESQAMARNGLRYAALIAGATALCGFFLTQRRKDAKVFGFAPLRLCVNRSQVALPLLLLTELTVLGAWAEVEPAPASTADPHAGALTFLRSDTGWFRVDVDADARGLWSPGALQAAGFESPQGSGNPMELAAFGQFYWAVPFKGAPAYQLFGAKYIIVPKGAQPGGDGIWPVYLDDPLVDIHLNTNAMNRVWLVYETVPVETIEAAYAVIFAPDFTPLTRAAVENGPILSDEGASGGNGVLEVLTYGPNRARFGVHGDEDALLVLSDIHYPGWTATLDGQPTLLYKTNGILRGVAVPPGDHVVEMRFFPISLKIGLGLWGMGILGFISGAWLARAKPTMSAMVANHARQGAN